MPDKLPDEELRRIKDLPANARHGQKMSQTLSWTRRRHELRMSSSNGTEDAAYSERGRKFVANLKVEERKIIKRMVAERALAAEKKEQAIEKMRRRAEEAEHRAKVAENELTRVRAERAAHEEAQDDTP